MAVSTVMLRAEKKKNEYYIYYILFYIIYFLFSSGDIGDGVQRV